jgi:MFS family permease
VLIGTDISVSTALPTLGRVFHDASISSWVGTAYLLTSTACQPLYGRLSDIFGRKFVLLGSMGFFLVGSILCAISQSMIMLIVFRKSPSMPYVGWNYKLIIIYIRGDIWNRWWRYT